jgi:hypothetical protein
MSTAKSSSLYLFNYITFNPETTFGTRYCILLVIFDSHNTPPPYMTGTKLPVRPTCTISLISSALLKSRYIEPCVTLFAHTSHQIQSLVTEQFLEYIWMLKLCSNSDPFVPITSNVHSVIDQTKLTVCHFMFEIVSIFSYRNR